MEYIEIEIEKKSLECSIKSTEKAMVTQLLLQAFNITGIAWNGWWLLHAETGLTSFAFCLGAFVSTTLCTMCFVVKYGYEILDYKRNLRLLKKLK